MLKHFLSLIIILSIVKTHGCVNSCLDLDGNPVDQWVLLTPPDLHISDNEDTKYGFYFGVAPVSPDNDGSPMYFQLPYAYTRANLAEVKSQVENLFRSHVKHAARENQAVLTEIRDSNQPTLAPRFWNYNGNKMPQTTNKPKVYQYWINDQAQEKTNIQRAKTAGKSFQYTIRDIPHLNGVQLNFKASHSKWMISQYVSTKQDDDYANRRFPGYMIVHSFPKVPAELYPQNNDWFNPDAYNPKIFTEETGANEPLEEEDPDDGDLGDNLRNPFKYSQHAYCFNINSIKDMGKIDIMLDQNLPYFATFNFYPRDQSYEKYARSLVTRRHGKEEMATAAVNCLSTYENFYIAKDGSWNKASKCFKDYSISKTSHLISHVPLPHVITKLTPIPANANSGGRIVDATRIAPISWAQVSEALGTTIMLSHWRTLPLPNLKLGLKGVKKVQTVQYSNEHKAWDANFMHEKIGVGRHKKYVCFGDANHSGTQLSHAGITICVKDPELHAFFTNGIQVLQKDKGTIANVLVSKEFDHSYVHLLPRDYKATKDLSGLFVSKERKKAYHDRHNIKDSQTNK